MNHPHDPVADLEERLRRALHAQDPGEGFAERVLASLDATPAPAPRRRSVVAQWALAASVVLAVATGWLVLQERARIRNETAARQLAFALDLTSRELDSIQRRLNRTPENGS